MLAQTRTPAVNAKVSVFAALLGAALFSIVAPQSAHADQTDDIVSATLDAFITLGPKYGFNITETEKKFVAPFASCLVRGSPVVDCSKDAIISFLPKSAQPVARCVAKGTPVSDCAIHIAPEEMQAASRCVSEVIQQRDDCIKEQLIKRIPDQRTRDLAICMNTGVSPILCATQFGQGDVADALSKIGGRGSENIGKPDGLISNIVGVIAGIQNKDFGKVLKDGGEAVAKLVARTALNILTAGTPFVNYISGDIIDAVIEHRVDALVDFFNAVKSRNPGDVARVVIHAYYTMFAVVPCTAMRQVFPIEEIPDALCGLAGKIFEALSNIGGGLVGNVFGALVAGLNEIGQTIDDIVSSDVRPEHCGSAMDYLSKYQLQCVRAVVTEAMAETTFRKPEQPAARATAVQRYWDIISHVQDGCRVWFEQCYDGTRTIDKFCRPLIEPFTTAAEQTAQGIYDAGRIYSRKLVSDAFPRESKSTLCKMQQAMTSTLTQQCEKFIQQRYPMLPTPEILFRNARDDADELVEEHRFRKCTPSNYQMSTTKSPEAMACASIAQQVANMCADRGTLPFENVDRNLFPQPISPRDIVSSKNNPGFIDRGMTGEDAKRKFGNTHQTAVSLAERGELREVDPRPLMPHGSVYKSMPGVSVSRGVTVRDTVRTNPGIRNPGTVVAPRHGGISSTAPNPQIQIQRPPTILYQPQIVIPRQLFQQPQRGAIGSRTTTVNPAPGTNQTRTIPKQVGKSPATKPDQRINYGSCSGCKPTPQGSGYPGLR